MGWYDDRVDDDRIRPDVDERRYGGVRAYGLEGYEPEDERDLSGRGRGYYGRGGMGGYGGRQGGYAGGERAGFGGMGGAMGDYYAGGGQGGAGVGRGQGFPVSLGAWRSDAFGTRSRDDVGEHVGKGPRGYERNWDRIRDEVCHSLAWSGQVDASDIEVTVERGEITLGGTVPDRNQKRLAERIAERVYGVEDVHNRLRLAPAGRPGVRSDEDAIEQTRPRKGGGKVSSRTGPLSRQQDKPERSA
jgi:hypothetical protein